MNLDELRGTYLRDETTQLITGRLQQGKARLQLRGLSGSAGSFIAAAAAEAGLLHLVILSDKEEAAYFLNDIESILGRKNEQGEIDYDIPVLYFPSSYRKAYQVEETDNASVLLRAEVLDRVRREKGGIIVTYPLALAEKVVTRKALEQNTLRLHRSEKVSIHFITDLLQEYGFERVDYVIEAGQFSVRGGIVDVFSFANELPYRIEFFGDEVDSIRTFDPLTQLSVKALERLTIIPNVQGKLLQESRESFFSYLLNTGESKPVLWIKDIEQTQDTIGREFESAQKTWDAEVSQSPLKHLPPSEVCINGEDFRREMLDYSIAEFGNRFMLPDAEQVSFETSPQPSFQKNFNLLTQHFAEQAAKGYRIIIFADSAKQVERLYSIFEDIGRKFEFTPMVLSIHEGFIDHKLKIACYTDHQVFERYHRFRLRDGNQRKKEAMTLKELRGLNPGDFVTHIDHGVGRFGGLEKIEVNGKLQEAVRLFYRDNDILYVSIHSLHRISKYAGKEGQPPKINKLGSNAWQNLKQKTKSKVKEIAYDLIQLYAKRKAMHGFRFAPDNYLQHELEASFIYEDTPDQLKATQDVKRDMEMESPMDRLVCGDVGFGKTEVAIRAAFKAVCDSKQVAVLVPTTILALQHYKTFKDRLKDFPARVDYINRFRSAKEKKEILQKLTKGEIDILIGTHGIVGKEVKFKDLGLLIVDEEQKFGVAVKDKLKTLKTEVDTLTLTATPIPRTLQFSLMSARDLSVINTPPANRYPVQTELHTFSEELIRDAVMQEVQRGGQVFFVHNRVQGLPEIAGMISRLCPEVHVVMGHGQMEGHKLEEAMLSFVEGEADVLVSTTIIESGLDISNANTIIINDAQNFGLSDLHQMRGRVGRSNKKAFCYLVTPPMFMLTSEAQKRLRAIEEFSDLGSGFNIAMRDLDIRGAGNLLGGEQSGFIADIGFDMYQKILDEAIQELKETEFKDLFLEEEKQRHVNRDDKHTRHTGVYIKDTQIDTDLEILLPDEYVDNITERLALYRRLDDSDTEDDLTKFEEMLRDRFGPVPQQTLELIDAVRLRWLGMEIGIEKMILKNGKLIGYFISNQQSPYYQSEAFSRVLKFMQANPRAAKMKEMNNKLTLTFENIRSVRDAIHVLEPVIQ
ncbi:MAG: transcription-repair coupling factor (superfamily II helicase) [Bacteroidetes bacterium]|nr:MAG: transcription-repair coupling factor (superfamily II helicase) [Bacteroidota bacterium]